MWKPFYSKALNRMNSSSNKQLNILFFWYKLNDIVKKGLSSTDELRLILKMSLF